MREPRRPFGRLAMTDGMGRQSWWPSAAARVGDTKARPATARAARGRRPDRARAGWLRPRDAARIRELQDVEVARLDDASLEQDSDDEATNGRGLEELHENAEDRRHLDAVVIKDYCPGGPATARHAPSQCVGGEWIAR